MGAVGYQSHQQEAAATYRRHHQERGSRLRKVAQSREGNGKNRREHDCLEEIVGYQGYQRSLAQVAQYQADAHHATDGTDKQCRRRLDIAHHPTAEEATHHEESQGYGQDQGSRAVGHPVHTGYEIDEVGIDGNLRYLIAQECQESEDKHTMMLEEFADVGTIRLVFFRLLMLDFWQVDT